MSQRRLWVSAAIIACVVIVGFILSVPHTTDVPNTRVAPAAEIPPPVTLHDVYKKGVHTITGFLTAPNACTSAFASASLTGDSTSTESIRVAILMPIDAGVCLQVPTRVSFETAITAASRLPLSASVNGILASTTLQ